MPEVFLALYAEGAGKEKLCVFDKHKGRGEYALGLEGNKASLKSTIDEMETLLKPVIEIVAALKTGGAVKASPDNVLHYNWLQFQWSHRFILCAEGAFDVAAKMLKEHPELRTGIAIKG